MKEPPFFHAWFRRAYQCDRALDAGFFIAPNRSVERIEGELIRCLFAVSLTIWLPKLTIWCEPLLPEGCYLAATSYAWTGRRERLRWRIDCRKPSLWVWS